MRALVDIELDAMVASKPIKDAAVSLGIGTAIFYSIVGRLPAADAMTENFVRSIAVMGGTREDIEWCIAAEILPAGAMTIWDEVTK